MLAQTTPQTYPAYQQPYPAYQGAVAYNPYAAQPGVGIPAQGYAYGQGYGYPVAAPPAGAAGGFAFVSSTGGAAKKDPFDFGDLSKLASNM